MLTILFYIFIGIVLIQIIYYTAISSSITSYAAPKQNTQKRIPISVLVYIKDQAEYVRKIVPILVNQSYSDFEIVLINDASQDDSLDIMEELAEQYSNIKIVNVINNEAFWENKRYAMTLGIKGAKHEHLLFTEANSLPDSNLWITNMSSQFTNGKTVIIGHNRIEKIQKSFINKLFRFENTLSSAKVFYWTIIGRPFMGTGHNLAYTKENFFKANGFINHMKKPNGEDVLFINQISNSENATVCIEPTGFTAKEINNRCRDLGAFLKDQNKALSLLNIIDQLKIKLYNITQITIFVLAIILLSFQFNWIYVLGILALRYLIIWYSTGKIFKTFNEKDIIYWFPALEFIHTFTQFYIYISNSLSKSKH